MLRHSLRSLRHNVTSHFILQQKTKKQHLIIKSLNTVVFMHNRSEDKHPSPNHCLSFFLLLQLSLHFFVLSSKLCFYWRPILIALQNVIHQAVNESILSFNDQPTWYAFYMAPYTYNGNQWKANNTGSQWAACLTDGCGCQLFVNTHGSFLSHVALCCIRLDECGCKGGSLWVTEWLIRKSIQSCCYIHPPALSSKTKRKTEIEQKWQNEWRSLKLWKHRKKVN